MTGIHLLVKQYYYHIRTASGVWMWPAINTIDMREWAVPSL